MTNHIPEELFVAIERSLDYKLTGFHLTRDQADKLKNIILPKVRE